MKIKSIFAVIGILLAVNSALSEQAEQYRVAERGANHRIFSRTIWETNAVGKALAHTNSYTELETGMHYRSSGEWLESKAEIELTPDGAAATNGQHKVSFKANLNSQIAIDYATPDGDSLRSRVIGLGYYDSESGQAVLIAETKDSVGEVQPPNRVIYADAFTGVEADVEYVYTKSSFSQNIILREQPPALDLWDLNPATTTLQVLTEFIDPPAPEKITTKGDSSFAPQDETLRFGQMRIGQGEAFAVGNAASDKRIPVTKTWVNLEGGRTFLVEEVKIPSFAAEALSLPASKRTAQLKSRIGRGKTLMAALNNIIPKTAAIAPKRGSMRMAKLTDQERQGFVLDYEAALFSAADFTFAADATYYCTNTVNLTGQTVIEGGTVIKFSTNTSAKINCGTDVICKTGPYRPAIFTAKDDNSVGDTIGGSTGTPLGYYGGGVYLQGLYSTPTPKLSNMRFSYLRRALSLGYDDAQSFSFGDAQFINCDSGIYIAGGEVTLDNALFYRVTTNFIGGGESYWTARHMTVDQCNTFNGGEKASLYLTNCLLIAITNFDTSGLYWLYTNQVVQLSDPATVFQTVGAGSHYLATYSPYRNVGTTNISPALMADLKKKTTYPPIVYAYAQQRITNDLVLSPQAPRDTDLPDLGYHYDPLDFVFGATYITNATVTVLPGTSIGTFAPTAYGYGLFLHASSSLKTKGTPTSPVRISRYSLVQEQANTNWIGLGTAIIGSELADAAPPSATFRFTHWFMPAQDGDHFKNSHGLLSASFANCEFYGGKLFNNRGTLSITNCLFRRVTGSFDDSWGDYAFDLTLCNCLFYGGVLGLSRYDSGNWTITDNLFDRTTLYQEFDFNTDYNGFATGTTNISPGGVHDVITNIVYQAGPFGEFYQTNTSGFLNKGSTNANYFGLYHFTVTTNLSSGSQIKETNSVVDLGYHYVAVNSVGQPIDTDSDGLADYREDANGNGSYNSATDLSDWDDADTDNDGVDDGVEIAQGRNPKISGVTSGPGAINLRVFTPLK